MDHLKSNKSKVSTKLHSKIFQPLKTAEKSWQYKQKNMKIKKFGYRSEKRSQRSVLRKAVREARPVNANPAFIKIRDELVSFGWFYIEGFTTGVDLDGEINLTKSPALKLINEKSNATLIPHATGIEISKLEVTERFQGHGIGGQFLDNILNFLQKNEIDEIYVLPMQVGYTYSPNSLSNNIPELQKFYQKRGFVKLEGSIYWILDKKSLTTTQKEFRLDENILRSIPLRAA